MAKVLIVEDDEAVRTFTARAIASAGFEVSTAEDGDEGLSSIRENEGRFDLVLSDIRMPAMDGIEMAKRAAGEFPGLKILLMTGYAEQRERAADLEDIVIDVVPKPFSLAQIREKVAKALI
ncbi:response regulator [Aquamicrobium sp. LC103]|uniref:response regulator n=1 Tax=Aquamicrobium sp. LC103 TaxID=1120658 RepID=UPI00063E73C5|nr:response regulator [Aquamicrobium sp. LC103]TKT75291.1 response regulator [Aquamicrobium sp. LC103]